MRMPGMGGGSMRASKSAWFLVGVLLLVCASAPVVQAAAAVLGPADGDGLTPTDLDRIKVGDLAPDFTLETESGTPISLSQFRGKSSVILVFYRGHW